MRAAGGNQQGVTERQASGGRCALRCAPGCHYNGRCPAPLVRHEISTRTHVLTDERTLESIEIQISNLPIPSKTAFTYAREDLARAPRFTYAREKIWRDLSLLLMHATTKGLTLAYICVHMSS